MLQDKINEIKPYFKSLESYNDALIIRVQFPDKWAVFASDDGLIKPAPSENKAHEFFYYGDAKKVSLEDIFDFIKNTIEVNKSIEIKAKLLVQKANELQKLFETTPLEQLKTLKFTFETPKKPKRKYTKKKKDNIKEAVADDKVKENTSGNTTSVIEISPSTLDKFKKVANEKNKENE